MSPGPQPALGSQEVASIGGNPRPGTSSAPSMSVESSIAVVPAAPSLSSGQAFDHGTAPRRGATAAEANVQAGIGAGRSRRESTPAHGARMQVLVTELVLGSQALRNGVAATGQVS